MTATHLLDEETARLRALWSCPASCPASRPASRPSTARREEPRVDPIAETLGAEAAEGLDPFDRVQLAEVLRVCRASRSLSEAGRALFAASRTRKSSVNDADRLRKYLARFGIDWKQLAAAT